MHITSSIAGATVRSVFAGDWWAPPPSTVSFPPGTRLAPVRSGLHFLASGFSNVRPGVSAGFECDPPIRRRTSVCPWTWITAGHAPAGLFVGATSRKGLVRLQGHWRSRSGILLSVLPLLWISSHIPIARTTNHLDYAGRRRVGVSKV